MELVFGAEGNVIVFAKVFLGGVIYEHIIFIVTFRVNSLLLWYRFLMSKN